MNICFSVLLALIDQEEIDGCTSKSNFQFGHSYVSEVYFQQGEKTFPNVAFTPKYTGDGAQWNRPYASFFAASGIPGKTHRVLCRIDIIKKP